MGKLIQGAIRSERLEVSLSQVTLDCEQTILHRSSLKEHSYPKIPRILVQETSVTTESALHEMNSRLILDTILRFPQTWDFWKWEAIACFFVLSYPFIIVATLHPHKGLPLPQWVFGVSFNALLSIYSVVFKACLTFIVASCIGQLQWAWFLSDRPMYNLVRYNEAANGPWGSVQLLWTQNIQQPLTAFGAIILIAAVAIDPIIQQLITTVDCSVLLRQVNATLPRTNMPDSRWSLGFRVPSAEAVPRLVTTVYNPSDSISWKCSTGNCTFPEYGTLEYCSSCEDFSASILFNNTKKESGLPLKDFLAGPQPENSLWLNMTYSSRSNGTSLDDTATISTDLCTAAFVSRGISGGTTVSAILVGKTDNSAPGRFAGCENPGPRDSWRCRGYGAAVCTVHPCVRTYKAYIKAGRLDQHMVSQSDFMIQGIGRNKPLGEWLGMVDTQCVTEDEIKELQQQGSKSDRSSRWLVINDSHFDAPFARLALDSLYSSLLARKCLYLVDRFSSASIVERALTNDLYGQIRGTHIRLIPPYLGATEQFTDYHLTGPNALHLLYKNNDIDLEWIQSSFANFSSTLSIWVRTYGSERNSEPAIGEVWHYATCLRVGWRWLCFPAVLVGATILFFFMVVFTTDRQQLSIWKLSPLPWILRGNGKEAGLAGRGETTIVAMEQKSKEMMITLLKGSGPRIQLVESEDEKRSDERITNIEDVENSVSIEGGTDMIVNDETRSD